MAITIICRDCQWCTDIELHCETNPTRCPECRGELMLTAMGEVSDVPLYADWRTGEYNPDLFDDDDRRQPESLLPLDVGFDLKLQKMTVDVTRLNLVIYLDQDGDRATVGGTPDQIAEALIQAGYHAAIVGLTDNGREIRYEQDRKYHVQPHNDNYWLAVATLDEARDAYHHPEKYRA